MTEPKINGDVDSSSTFTFKWHVRQITASLERDENDIVSPQLLTVYANHVLHWRLRLSRNLDREGYRNYLAVYLDYFDEHPMTTTVIFAMLNSGQRVFQRVTKAKFDRTLNFCGIIDFVQQDLVTDSNMNLLRNDSVIVTCEVRFQDFAPCVKVEQLGAQLGKLSVRDEPRREEKKLEGATGGGGGGGGGGAGLKIVTASTPASDLKSLSDDLEKLLESESYSDVSFIIGEKKIRAHKNVLTARSPAFVKMFAHHENAERKRSLVGVKDVRYDVMKEVLRYIYAGRANDVEKMAAELLMAAEKYALAGLKAVCERTLGDRLKYENALEYLALAKTFNAAKLNAKVMDFVIARLGDYVSTPQFRELSVEIKDDLLNAVSKKKIPR